jgi:hypothetical protein
MHRNRWMAITLCCSICALAHAARADKLGILGDSLSDEYAEQTYGAYSQNWVEQLVLYRGIDAGPTGTWGEPRRNYYEYNWARYGADSVDMLTTGQHTGLAAQVVPNSLDYAVTMIGANDQFGAGNPYFNIYAGAWSPAQISTWVTGVVNNIDTALNTVMPTGVKLVLFGAPDYGVAPLVQATYTSPSGRQAVADVLANQLNPQIEALAQAYQVPYVDLQAYTEAVFGPHNALNATLAIGNVNINLMQSDNAAGTILAAGFVDDGIHPHTTIQGLIANLSLEALNVGYNANLTLFSEQEILAHRGIAYGGSDTLVSQVGPYSDYITNYVPEPSTLALAAMAVLGMIHVVAARCRRVVGRLAPSVVCVCAIVLFTAEVRAGTIGLPLIDRAGDVSSSGGVFVFDTAIAESGTVSTWGFFDNDDFEPARSVTPLVFERTGNVTYTLRGVGTPRTTTEAGVQSGIAFGLIAGSDLVSAGTYTFGFADAHLSFNGTLQQLVVDSASAGSIDTDDLGDLQSISWPPALNLGRFLPGQSASTLQIGASFGIGDDSNPTTIDVISGDLRAFSAQMTVVPEPSALALAAAGALGLLATGFARRWACAARRSSIALQITTARDEF